VTKPRRNLIRVPELPLGAHLVAIAYGTGKDDYLAAVLGFIPNEEDNPEHDRYVTWTWSGFRKVNNGLFARAAHMRMRAQGASR